MLVEALPADMPEALEVSLESLVEFDTYLYAKDIKTGEGVEVISDPEFLLAAVTRPRIVADAAADEEIVEGEQAAEEGETSEEAAAEGGEASEETAAE